MLLRELRISKKLTQVQVANLLGVNRRTYINYEQGKVDLSKPRFSYIFETLQNFGKIDESHGIYNIEDIKDICSSVFKEYDISFCYLFGSYAKGKATEISDIDLFVSMPSKGVEYYDLLENLKERFKKNIDLIHETQLNSNLTLTKEIMKNGIKIYG